VGWKSKEEEFLGLLDSEKILSLGSCQYLAQVRLAECLGSESVCGDKRLVFLVILGGHGHDSLNFPKWKKW
jgi:hypothetical protein